jgi:hypothetical protein
MLFG